MLAMPNLDQLGPQSELQTGLSHGSGWWAKARGGEPKDFFKCRSHKTCFNVITSSPHVEGPHNLDLNLQIRRQAALESTPTVWPLRFQVPFGVEVANHIDCKGLSAFFGCPSGSPRMALVFVPGENLRYAHSMIPSWDLAPGREFRQSGSWSVDRVQ